MNEQLPAFTIFVHVYYPEIWEEMLKDLERIIKQPFRLVITRPVGSTPAAIPNTSYLHSVDEFEVDNRGRDILPFLKALKADHEQASDIGLKLHTKHSPHRADGADWRRFLCASLLRVDGESRLLGHSLLEREHRIGLIAPEAHLLALDGRISINGAGMAEMLIALYGKSSAGHPARQFAAGSMFWFRRAGLDRLIEKETDYLFAQEHGQLDGTAAHALERLFVTIVERQGLIAAGIENAIPILSAPHETMTSSDLVKLVEKTLVHQNQFAVALPAFWRKNPCLLRLLHVIYARLPKKIVRFIHNSRRRVQAR